jgi:hypothetical protein
MTYGKVVTIPEKKLKKMPFLEREFFKIVPATTDVTEVFRRFYGFEKKARTKGTFVRFGEGEERFGEIVKIVPKGVFIQEIVSDKELGMKLQGKPFFVKQERFERHLGEAGAVGVEVFRY